MDIIREFFGIGGYTRTPEGAYSWQHLTFVGLLLAAMTFLAIWLGRRNRGRDSRAQNRVMIWAALLIDGFELIKIGLACYENAIGGNRPWYDGILYNLPLFLCSIQLITIPLAAFTKGRLKEASADFVAAFGLLGAVLGTVGAAQNYGAYPVLSFTNVVSGITHCISGFAALYLFIAGIVKLEKKNIPVTFGVLGSFCVMAYVVNRLIDYNYMFLMAGDGTPYDILYNLVGGSPLWYPLCGAALLFAYLSVFYIVRGAIVKKKEKVTV